MGFVDIAVRVLLVLQILAASFLCLFGIYCCLMVRLHIRNKKEMLARDTAVIEAWSRSEREVPFVTVQLPLYNERYVVDRLIENIVLLDYPQDRYEIQILDDSTDDTTQIVAALVERYRAQGFTIELVHRVDRTGFKAGALKEGNDTAKGEFIAIFDADFVPAPDFLKKTLPFFDDPEIAVVQTLWGHLNADYSRMTKAQAVALDGLNYVVQSAQCWSGLLMHFQGTAGVWRRTAINDAGGWQADTLTEDLDISYRAQVRGWKLKYLPQVICPGELPTTVSAAKTQQHRWAKGGFQVMCKMMPDILRSRIPWYAKAEAFFYMISMILQPCLMIISVSWPAQLWLRQEQQLAEAALPVILFVTLCSFGPHVMFLYAQVCLYKDWPRRVHHYLYLMLWSMGVAVTNTRAILEVAFNIKTGFVRTPKYRIERQGDSFVGKGYRAKLSSQILIEGAIALYCLFGLRPVPLSATSVRPKVRARKVRRRPAPCRAHARW
jgi:cellulose synthase/poly-beta-1,6-N-acetylglucosamine synthase-like glycosyltransferase